MANDLHTQTESEGPENLDMGMDLDMHDGAEDCFDQDAVAPLRGVTVEEIVDDEVGQSYYAREFSKEQEAGATFGEAPTTFEVIRDEQILKGAEILGPFSTEEEWQLAKWLIKNVGHNQAEEFLHLPIVSQCHIVGLFEQLTCSCCSPDTTTRRAFISEQGQIV